MDKYLKIVLIIVAVLMLISLGKSFFGGNDNLSEAIDNIKKSQQKIDSSLIQINYARNRIDSLRNDMQDFKMYIKDIQGRVEILDLENRKSIVAYQKYRDSLKNRLNDLYHTIDTTADNLPNLIVAD